jgi:hypothetical protein
LIAFGSGIALTVVFEKFTDANGITNDILFRDDRLPPLCTVFKTEAKPATREENDFHKTLAIVATDWRILHALHDLIEANTIPHVSSINCARVVERLRHIIAGDQPRNDAWRKMREVLNISEAYLKLITDVSADPRHGDPIRITGNVTMEIIFRTWAIMNRFLEYKKGSDQQLPITKFPLLTP